MKEDDVNETSEIRTAYKILSENLKREKRQFRRPRQKGREG
jgi:hypothetical protein